MQTPPAVNGSPSEQQADYFEHKRKEMHRFIPANALRILDVGCGAGAFGAGLKEERKVEVWGVEMNEGAATIARSRLDKVFTSKFHAGVIRQAAHFDCITFNDVLEHMEDPESALRVARSLLADEGVIVASIPNVRHFSVLWDLVIRGQWNYQDAGILDRTHLRFFTRSSINTLFGAAGFRVNTCVGINEARGRKYELINLVSLGRLYDARFVQFGVVAEKTKV